MKMPDAFDNATLRLRLSSFFETLAAALTLFPAAIITVAIAYFVLGRGMGAWVLPMAAVATVIGLRVFSTSWREAGLTMLLAVAIHVVAGLIVVGFPDGSWDGLAIHQEALLRLAAGWNPLVEGASAYGHGSEIYIDHYPKASWIAGAAILLSTGHLEAGKLFNLTLMLAAGCMVTSALLRITQLRVRAAVGLALVTALNPVFIYQSTTFYVDGPLASALTVLVAGLAVYVAAPRWRSLGVALLAGLLVINLKLTGLVYVAVLETFAVLVVWWRHGLPTTRRMAASTALAGIIGAVLLGYAPYIQNLRDHGDLFYPVISAPHLGVDTATMRPVNLNDKDRFTRFLVSNFSYTQDGVRPPLGTTLKFPFRITRGELWNGGYAADVEAGGFGPLYGGLLVLAAVAGLVLVAHPATRSSGLLVVLFGACLFVSVFVHRETWWARYVPQAWLVPMAVAAAGLCAPRGSLARYLGSGLIWLASANVLIVGVNFASGAVYHARASGTNLRQMAALPQPVSVYLGPQRSLPLRQRLREAGVDFQMVETPALLGRVRHSIPAASGTKACWFE